MRKIMYGYRDYILKRISKLKYLCFASFFCCFILRPNAAFVPLLSSILSYWAQIRKSKRKPETTDDRETRWEKDYRLEDFPERGMYGQYLEMGL